MKHLKLIVLFIFCAPLAISAGEGMWLPLLLKQLNEAEMQSLGMKMTAEDIYSVNNGSLKDAIVHFGGFCTSEIISSNGLLLTNHHCGYGQIQSHSTLENNYLEDGFWAMSKEEELPNPGLTATFIDRIEDITTKVLGQLPKDISEKERQSMIDQKIDEIRKSIQLESYQDIIIRPFFHGNQYFMFITTTYRDVRLVGAPPSSIGKFGADTDNWEWPRHTGDFSLFRIYADENNLPADYSPDNVPFTPKHFLPISLDGVEENDFTLIFGFPGRTNEYLPAVAIEQIVDVLNPAKIGIRDNALKIVDAAMKADKQVKIQYASKYASIANYWKKWIGESQGLKQTNAIEKKRGQEKKFLMKVNNSANYSEKYGSILAEFDELYAEIEPFALSRDYYSEIFNRNVEIFRVANYMNRLANTFENNGTEGYNSFKGRLQPFLEGMYKNYRSEIDQKVFAKLIELFVEGVPVKLLSSEVKSYMFQLGEKDYAQLAFQLYSNSFMTDWEKMKAFFEKSPEEAMAQLEKDPLYQFNTKVKKVYDEEVASNYNTIKNKIDLLQRQYMKGLIEIFPTQRFYPDANSTMRVTYGQVEGYAPKDGVQYEPLTYLSGVVAKYKPGDYEFDLPKKLIDLHDAKDYGQYASDNGKLPVCFLGSNHTTGGNSGSPAIDAYGNLIGLNFDRVWEGTMSDYNYDRSICRNIMVDARYILFIIDKFADAGHLIEEMKLVHPKKNPPQMEPKKDEKVYDKNTKKLKYKADRLDSGEGLKKRAKE